MTLHPGIPGVKEKHLSGDQFIRQVSLPGQSMKWPPGKGGRINTSQAEPVAANSRAVGQFLSISCEAFI